VQRGRAGLPNFVQMVDSASRCRNETGPRLAGRIIAGNTVGASEAEARSLEPEASFLGPEAPKPERKCRYRGSTSRHRDIAMGATAVAMRLLVVGRFEGQVTGPSRMAASGWGMCSTAASRASNSSTLLAADATVGATPPSVDAASGTVQLGSVPVNRVFHTRDATGFA
jgi:hypothetical protein